MIYFAFINRGGATNFRLGGRDWKNFDLFEGKFSEKIFLVLSAPQA